MPPRSSTCLKKPSPSGIIRVLLATLGWAHTDFCGRVAFILAAVVLILGCCEHPASVPTAKVPPVTITVFAAASTIDVITEAAKRFQATHPVAVRFSFDSSSTLATQIIGGAPADVFLSADEKWMDEVEKRGGIETRSRTNLLGNRLALIAAADAGVRVEIEHGFDLAAALPDNARVAMADPTHVPAGRYAKQALEWLGWWTTAEARLVVTQDVRGALRLVESGEADLGIVYATDAKVARNSVVVGLFPAESHEPVRYPIAINARGKPQASEFIAFLRTGAMKDVFEKAGFTLLTGEQQSSLRSSSMHPMLATTLLSPEELSTLWLSMRVSSIALALMLIPGIGCGWLLARRDFFGKSILDALVHLPLVLPPVVVGYLLLAVLGRRGVIGTWLHDALGIDVAFTRTAAMVAAAVMGFPLLVRSVRLAIELVDVKLEQAACSLGATPWRVFMTITLPLALPGVLAGCVLAFARSLGEFGATITFAGNIQGETRTLPVAVFTSMQQVDGDAAALRLVVVSLALSITALAISEFLARRMRHSQGRA
jgi:molybdate transport system permease protein